MAMLCEPSANGVLGVRMVLPWASVLTVAGTALPSTSRRTVSTPAGNAPMLKSGLGLAVLLSVLLLPVSVPAVMSGAVAGADGPVVSMVTGSRLLGSLVLPAASVAVALRS